MEKIITYDLYRIIFSFLMINVFFLPLLAYGLYISNLATEYLTAIAICGLFLILCDATSNKKRTHENRAWLESRLKMPILFFFPGTVTKLEKQAILEAKNLK